MVYPNKFVVAGQVHLHPHAARDQTLGQQFYDPLGELAGMHCINDTCLICRCKRHPGLWRSRVSRWGSSWDFAIVPTVRIDVAVRQLDHSGREQKHPVEAHGWLVRIRNPIWQLSSRRGHLRLHCRNHE